MAQYAIGASDAQTALAPVPSAPYEVSDSSWMATCAGVRQGELTMTDASNSTSDPTGPTFLSVEARVATMVQMLLNLVLFGLAAKVIFGAIDVGLRRRAAEERGGGDGAGADDE
jgi:hypothetical protein